MHFIHTEEDLDAGLAALGLAEPRFAQILAAAGRPPLRRREGGYAGLVQIVCAQQLSTASASAIFGRLTAAFVPLDHHAIRTARTDKLRRAGLSMPKIRALKAIGTAIHKGDLDLDALATMEADEAHGKLTTVHGIGPWTADIYLLACLGHSDAWPAGDLALQEAARMAFGLARRPTTKEMGPLADAWRPWRGVAARLLWSYYRHAKGREGLVPQAKPAAATKKAATPRARKRPARAATKRKR
jgi:DNA-3-methyladenine glycosylase II